MLPEAKAMPKRFSRIRSRFATQPLGVLVINAMQNFQIPLLWSAVLLAVLVSLTLFGLLGLLQHYVARRFR